MERRGRTKYGSNKSEHRFGAKQNLQRINNLKTKQKRET